MGDRQMLMELRRLDELQARTAAPPSLPAVAGNAALKGLAGLPDAVLNTPTNLWNLAKAGVGAGAIAAGRPEIGNQMEMSQAPNLVNRAMQKVGLIRPENEPQTAGQRMLDTAVQSGVGMAVAPARSVGQVAGNVLTGLTGGGAAGLTKEATGSDLAATAVGALTPLAQRGLAQSVRAKPTNPVQAETLRAGQAAGYVVPPATVNPSFVNERLESLAGKAAVKQGAGLKNQAVTNAIVARDLGLPPGTAITEEVLKVVRAKAGQVYEEVAQLKPTKDMEWFPRYHDRNLVEKMKQARADASQAYKRADRENLPAVRKKAERLEAEADSIEGDLAKLAVANKRPELVAALTKARTLYAKTYDIERAMNLGDANIAAAVLGRQLDKGGVKSKTGELATAGRFEQAFPQVMREGAKIPSPGVSGTDMGMAALLGTAGYGAAGGPLGLLAAGLPLARGPARSLALSAPYQRLLASKASPPSEAALRSLLLGRAIAERK